MLKEAICTGSSIEEAQVAAITQLNAPENANITIEVIEIPVKKTLGIFGGTLAKVRAYYEEADYLQAETYIRSILKGLGVNEVNITVEEVEDDIYIQLDCHDDYSIVIGHRGETLDAIQYLTRLIISKKTDAYKRVLVNVGNYREKREGVLRDMARKNAEKVKKYGSNMCLDPMNPYERRIIHTTIQEIEGVNSHSVGTENDRRVVISLADGVKATGGNYHGNLPPREGFQDVKRESRPAGAKTQDFRRKESKPSGSGNQPRAPRSDVTSATLYGKIEPNKK